MVLPEPPNVCVRQRGRWDGPDSTSEVRSCLVLYGGMERSTRTGTEHTK